MPFFFFVFFFPLQYYAALLHARGADGRPALVSRCLGQGESTAKKLIDRTVTAVSAHCMIAVPWSRLLSFQKSIVNICHLRIQSRLRRIQGRASRYFDTALALSLVHTRGHLNDKAKQNTDSEYYLISRIPSWNAMISTPHLLTQVGILRALIWPGFLRSTRRASTVTTPAVNEQG